MVDIQEIRERLKTIATDIRKGYGFCPQCGNCKPDEDGCCSECGADATGNELSSLAADILTLLNN